MWGIGCDSYIAMSLSWKNNGQAGAPSTRLTTDGYQWFGQSFAAGLTCEITLDLSLSPFQTFTQH